MESVLSIAFVVLLIAVFVASTRRGGGG